MKRNLFIFYFVASLILVGCLPMDRTYSFIIRNNSPQSIYIHAAFILPDTSLPAIKPAFIKVDAWNSESITDRYIGDDEFRRFQLEKLTVFILSKDTVDEYHWNVILDEYKILDRWEILSSDLEDDASISYPR